MAKLVFSISLCVLFLVLGSSLALRDQPQQNECQLEKLQSLEPDYRLNSEAGQIETWNPNNQHFRCMGVALSRCTLERHALRLPSYSNAPQLFYIQKGSGLFGMVFPGCAETFEEPQQSQSGRSKSQDRHQKIRRFRQGDIIAVPAGVAFWIYNSEENPVVAVSILDTGSHQNQLDQLPRRFYLAGNQAQEFLHYQQQQQQQPQQSHRQGEQQQSRREGRQQEQGSRGQQEEEQQQEEGSNIFNGFDEELLAQAFNVDQETARRIQGQKDKRVGGIVRVKGGLSLLSPPSRQPQQQQEEEDEEEEEQQQRQQRKGRRGGHKSESESENGLEETVCTMRLRQNIGKSTNPDIYNPQAGSLRTVNSIDLPVLGWLRLSAEYGSLHKNAIFVPHYNLNANSIIYALRGRAKVQVVDCSGNSVYNQELEAGQVLTVPQSYAIAAQAQTDKFEYVAFKTSGNAMIATLAGRTSVMKALPEEVVAQAYQLRRDQARQVKNNNPSIFLVAPRDSSQMRAVA